MGRNTKRISKRDYYIQIAKAVSKRSPCLKNRVGAIIVKNDTIIATGYNGPARGEDHCKECVRADKPHGSVYEKCPAIHSEENCIINAARYGVSVLGGKMYIYGKGVSPCYRCKRAMKNAGIVEVIYE